MGGFFSHFHQYFSLHFPRFNKITVPLKFTPLFLTSVIKVVLLNMSLEGLHFIQEDDNLSLSLVDSKNLEPELN